MALIDIHQCLLNVYGGQTVEVVYGAFQRCERQAAFQVTVHGCHIMKWRTSQSAHYLKLAKCQSVKWQPVNPSQKKSFKAQPSVGKVMCTVYWDRKRVILLGFLESRQTINSVTSQCWLSWILQHLEEKRQPFSCNTIMPGPMPEWIPWIMLPILAGVSYDIDSIIWI